MMRNIVIKVFDQAKYDGFVRFKDGNPINFSRYNLEKINFRNAVHSINTDVITDWNASLNKKETNFVKHNKRRFICNVNEITKFTPYL
ncbi:MAG: hypothetical protein WD512_11115 [Candidatus Paceibacterota bacterium]